MRDPQDYPCRKCGEYFDDHPELVCKANYDGLSCYQDDFEPDYEAFAPDEETDDAQVCDRYYDGL